MTRAQAIRLNCLDCSGSIKEVTLCHSASCPLWQYRFGNSLRSRAFDRRMRSAKTAYPGDFLEMLSSMREDSKKIEDKAVKAYVLRFLEANRTRIKERHG